MLYTHVLIFYYSHNYKLHHIDGLDPGNAGTFGAIQSKRNSPHQPEQKLLHCNYWLPKTRPQRTLSHHCLWRHTVRGIQCRPVRTKKIHLSTINRGYLATLGYLWLPLGSFSRLGVTLAACGNLSNKIQYWEICKAFDTVSKQRSIKLV